MGPPRESYIQKTYRSKIENTKQNLTTTTGAATTTTMFYIDYTDLFQLFIFVENYFSGFVVRVKVFYDKF